MLKVVKRLLDTGVSLQQIRVAIQALRERGVDDLAQITLMSDGASVYECTSADEVIDLVQGGQGVFGIAVGTVWREVEGELADAAQRARRGRGRRDAAARRRARAPGAQRPPGLSATARPRTEPASDSRGGLVCRFGARCSPRVGESPRARHGGAPKGQTSPEPLRRQDHAGQAPLERRRPTSAA